MGQEYPVSDANPGDASPKRPGMNAEDSDSNANTGGENQTKGRRRRRRNKRPRPPENGVQADSGNSQVSSADTSEDVRPQSAGDGSLVSSAKSSKRRRRRRGKGNRSGNNGGNNGGTSGGASGGNSGGGPNPQTETAFAETAAGGGGADQRRHNHNRAEGAQRSDGDDSQNQGLNRHSSGMSPADQSPNAAQAGDQPHSSNRQDRRKPYDKRRNRRRLPKKQFQEARSVGPDADQANPQAQAPKRSNSTNKKRPQRRHADAYAALDLGTNNCRLLVAVPQQPGRFKVIDAFSRIVRLGEGLAATGRLGDDAMDRAIGALKACAGKLENRKVRGVRLIATEACRRASNGGEFLTRVEQQAGIKLEVIDRETEARLAVAGCSSLVDRRAKGVVLFDIGGGSSELALLDLSKRKRHDLGPAMVSWTSLPLGVVTLSEKHGGGKLVTRAVFEDMVADVAEMLANFDGRHALQEAAQRGEIHLLGTSGTVTTLAGIHLKLPRYDRRQVDGIWMAAQDVDAMINQLVDMSFEQRVANPCIGRDRADLVLAGCAILVAIQQLWPCPRLRVADRGLREGLLTEMMNADNAWHRRPKYFRQNRT